MPNEENKRRFVIATLATWNILAGFGFYAYILDCYVYYPPNHQKRKFKYHTFYGTINQDVLIGISVVMVCQIISSVLLCLALKEYKNQFLFYGIFLSMAFPCACLPVWPLAVAHVSLALWALSYKEQ
ncbi:uncharacterized protein [Drosophila kikkawai]|uniref:Uncharacterized protein isoform X2 n=1 Tax=Drosophila kikkawai TaxID=30033 RepID=A0A6P4JF98_DROKI|nr:uncharacterized protein LOC108082399 [Drosophila kikkawai]